jgi:hypothetical protein
MQSIIARVDHLVYATPDVEQTIEELANLLGVNAEVGGRHPQWGTRNALLSLGSSCYLEMMGPDPTLSRTGLERPFGIDRLQTPRLASWACKSHDITKTLEIAKGVGVALGTAQPGQRTKPDGTVLTWKLTDLQADREGGIVPFLIDWGYSPHPAQNAPGGCTLKELWAEHPTPDRIRAMLEAFEIDLPIRHSKVARLKATIETKHGIVELE